MAASFAALDGARKRHSRRWISKGNAADRALLSSWQIAIENIGRRLPNGADALPHRYVFPFVLDPLAVFVEC
jgi:hypothetical protein